MIAFKNSSLRSISVFAAILELLSTSVLQTKKEIWIRLFHCEKSQRLTKIIFDLEKNFITQFEITQIHLKPIFQTLTWFMWWQQCFKYHSINCQSLLNLKNQKKLEVPTIRSINTVWKNKKFWLSPEKTFCEINSRNFFSETVALTRFLSKKCEGKFLPFPHCDQTLCIPTFIVTCQTLRTGAVGKTCFGSYLKI